MAGVVKNLMVRAGADFSAITKQSNKAKTSMRGMASSVRQSCNMMQSAAAGVRKAFGALGIGLGVAQIARFAKSAAEAYDAQVEGEVKLARVMRNTMEASDGEIQSILDLTAAQQALGIVGDEVQLAGAQELATYVGLSDTLKTLIPVLNDMAAQQYGYNVTAEQTTTIATMLGKVMEGQVSGLSRYGYYFDEAQEKILKYGNEAERAAVLAEVVGSSVGGMNAALAATPTGQMIQLKNTLGDVKEQFGQAVRTVTTTFLPALRAVANALAVVATLANRVALAIANVFGGSAAGREWKILGGSGGIGGAADAAEDLAENTQAAGSAARQAAKEYQQASFDTLHILKDPNSDTGSGGSGASSAAESVGGGGGFSYIEEDTGAATESIGWLQKALQGLKDFVGSLNFEPLREGLEKVRDACAHVGEIVKNALSWAWENVLKPMTRWTVEDALPAFFKLLGEVIEIVAAAIEKLQPLGKWLWENFLQKIAAWTGETFIKALESITDYLQRLTDLITGNTSFKEFAAQLSPIEALLSGLAVTLVLAGGGMKLFSTISSGLKGAVTLLSGVLGGLNLKFLLIVGGIAAVVAAGVWLYGHWEDVKKWASDLAEKVGESWEAIKAAVVDRVTELRETAAAKIDELKTSVVTSFTLLKTSVAAKVTEIKTTVTDYFTKLKDDVVERINELKTNITDKFSEFKATISDKVTEIKTNVVTAFTQIKTDAGNRFTEFKTGVVNRATEIKSNLVAKFTTLKDSVLSKIDALRTGAETKFNALKEKAGNIVQSIKDFFNFDWSLPPLKLPHLIVDWTPVDSKFANFFGIDALPALSVQWYAKGGVFDRASLIGVGDAGKEAVVPLERNTEWITRVADQLRDELSPAVRTADAGTPGDALQEVLRETGGSGALMDVLGDILDAVLTGHDIVMDGQRFGKAVRRSISQQSRTAGKALI